MPGPIEPDELKPKPVLPLIAMLAVVGFLIWELYS